MTQEERILIGETWLGLAQMYGKEVSTASISVMLNSISDLPFAEVMSVLNNWAKESKTGRHPFPVEILERIAPTVDDDSAARDVASRIVSAVKRFGWTGATEAKEHVGEIGWEIVRRHGGWQPLCENLPADTSIFQAQARDLAKSMMVLSRAGKLHTPPALPEGSVHPAKRLQSVTKVLSSVKSVEPEEEK